MPEDVLFQVVLPEGSKDPSAVVPFPVEQRLEVLIPAQLKILLLKFNKFVGTLLTYFIIM
jgi:hypothetical protein